MVEVLDTQQKNTLLARLKKAQEDDDYVLVEIIETWILEDAIEQIFYQMRNSP